MSLVHDVVLVFTLGNLVSLLDIAQPRVSFSKSYFLHGTVVYPFPRHPVLTESKLLLSQTYVQTDLQEIETTTGKQKEELEDVLFFVLGAL